MATNFKSRRYAIGYSNAYDLAKDANVPVESIYKLDEGNGVPDPSEFNRLCNAIIRKQKMPLSDVEKMHLLEGNTADFLQKNLEENRKLTPSQSYISRYKRDY